MVRYDQFSMENAISEGLKHLPQIHWSLAVSWSAFHCVICGDIFVICLLHSLHVNGIEGIE